MKIGDRGQVTIPKAIRDKFKLDKDTDVEFLVVDDRIVLQKRPQDLRFRKWKGRLKKNFSKQGYESVDDFIDDIRGR